MLFYCIIIKVVYMKDMIYEFLDYIILECKYSDNTELNYEKDLFKFETYLNDIKLDYLKVKYKDISNYLIYLRKEGYEPSTINRNLSSLRSFYNYLKNEKHIESNPLDFVRTVKQEKKLPNYFKYEEFILMLQTIDDNTPLNIRNKLIIELLFATGVRVSELINIKINDIDMILKQIKVKGKGSKDRIVYFGSYAKEAINEYLNNSREVLLKGKESDYLFINNKGTNLTDRGVRLIISNIIKHTSIKTNITPHTFRHSFATIMLNEGASIKTVQELLGHVSINTTSIYTHLTNEEVRKAYLKAHPRAKQ